MTAIVGEAGARAPFSEMLKAASWTAHEQAAQSPFMAGLMAGDLPRERYADLVAQQHAAYAVLEAAAEAMADDPVAGPFVRPELTRLPALEADLRFLLGDDWRSAVQPNAATRTYVDRLREVCFDWPGGFVAHHYVRYMGDLSGGQFIAKVVVRNYGLDGTDGTAFYDFTGLDDLSAFKDGYRQRLDAAPWGLDEQQRIVDEILLAYELNTAVLHALA
jgi:heme oxygenase